MSSLKHYSECKARKSFVEAKHRRVKVNRADRLVQGKHTVDDEDYRRKREGWIRTLLEDRYGRSARKSPATNAKLSGVPAFPHGQMDTFSSGPVDKIEARLLRKGQTGEIPHYKRRLKLEMQTGLKDIKMPWGW